MTLQAGRAGDRWFIVLGLVGVALLLAFVRLFLTAPVVPLTIVQFLALLGAIAMGGFTLMKSRL